MVQANLIDEGMRKKDEDGIRRMDQGWRIADRSTFLSVSEGATDIVGKDSLRAFNTWVHQHGTTSVRHSMREMDIMQY
jgi:hypothetical protein